MILLGFLLIDELEFKVINHRTESTRIALLN